MSKVLPSAGRASPCGGCLNRMPARVGVLTAAGRVVTGDDEDRQYEGDSIRRDLGLEDMGALSGLKHSDGRPACAAQPRRSVGENA